MGKIAKMIALIVLGMVMATSAFAGELKVVPTAEEVSAAFTRATGHLENAQAFIGEEKGYAALQELEWATFQMELVGFKPEEKLVGEMRALAHDAAMWEDLFRAGELSAKLNNVIIQARSRWMDQAIELNAELTSAIDSAEYHRTKGMQFRGEEP